MSRITNRRGEFAAIHVVVFLAGFSFLLYEVSWNRLLSLVLGTTVAASTIVLAVFMAGFGTGAYVWGNAAKRPGRLGRLLGYLLGGISLFSLATYFVIRDLVPRLYVWTASTGMPVGLCNGLIYFLVALVLFAPAFLIGGVFPLASRIASRSETSIAVCLGRLYAIETLGSAIGGLVTGFLLLGFLGQQQTVLIGIAINAALSIWIVITRRFDDVAPKECEADTNVRSGDMVCGKHTGSWKTTERNRALYRRPALVATFACGFAILGLQVFWIRIFRTYMTNTSYSFALISSVAILGLFAGSMTYKRVAGRLVTPLKSLYQALALFGVMTAIGLVILVYLPQLLMFPFQSILANPLARVFILPVAASVLIVFPPAICSGFVFPLACRMYTESRASIGRDVGFVLMVNTAGSVLGPILATFVLMPVFGVSLSVVFVLLMVCAALIYLGRLLPSEPRRRIISGAVYIVAVVLVGLLAFRPAIRILPPSFSRFDWRVLYYREGVEGTLAVGSDNAIGSGTKYTYVNNSAVIGSTYDSIKVVKMVGHTPFLMGLDCRDVLVIGFGIGVTTSAIASHAEVQSIECVELMGGIEDAAVFYRDLNHDVANDPRLTIRHGDGRHYLQQTTKRYDLISCDPTHPILGSGNLYTRDYFSLCRAHLNPGGMVSQYLPLHKLRPVDFQGIISTFHSVFPNCTVWLGHYHAVLLGALDPIQIDFEDWAAKAADIGEDIHFYSNPYHLAANLMLDSKAIAKLPTAHRLNTDDKSYTEFFAPDCLDPANISNNLAFFMENAVDVESVFSNIPDPEMMKRFVSGNRLLTESIYHQKRGDSQRGLAALQRACQINPEDEEFPFLIRLEY